MTSIHVYYIIVNIITIFPNGEGHLASLLDINLLSRLNPSNGVWIRMLLYWQLQFPNHLPVNDVFAAPIIHDQVKCSPTNRVPSTKQLVMLSVIFLLRC